MADGRQAKSPTRERVTPTVAAPNVTAPTAMARTPRLPPRGTEDVELTSDVYTTAFLLASNATESTYSVWPWRNQKMIIVWFYLMFIVSTQSFVILSLLWIHPQPVKERSWLIDCDSPTKAAAEELERLAASAGGSCAAAAMRSVAGLSDGAKALCSELDLELEVPISDERVLRYRRLRATVFFYEHIFGRGISSGSDVALLIVQLVCCVWVIAFVYFDDFKSVAHLLEFRDFNRWFLPLKGECAAHKQWVLVLPLVQMVLSTALVCVSCCITCALDEASDVVLNCLAFTFIGQVDDLFNKPLLRYYTTERLEGLSEEYTDEIYYLVGEYAEANAWNCDGADTPPEKWFDSSWYVKQEDKVAGLLHDFRFRHCPEDYERPSERLVALLRRVFIAAPVLAVLTCWALFTRTAAEHSLAS